MFKRRRAIFSFGLVALGALSLSSPPALAQAYPARPVTLVVPFPPGGGTDTGARILAEQLSRRWGQPVIIDNKGGASGQIGADFVAKAKPDGYTLLLGNVGTQAINPSLFARLPYDADKAFAPISLVAELPLAMMVNPAVPAHSVAEFIALARSRPGQLSYSSSGPGSGPHLAAEMFKEQTKTQMLHVPYRGGGPAVADLLAGHVQLSFMTVMEAWGHLKSGKLRALAVTSLQRVPALPEVPTLAESGLPRFNATSWIGALAPAGTPPRLVERIAADIQAVLASPAVSERFSSAGAIPRSTSPIDFAKLITDYRQRYGQIIRSQNISLE